MADHIAVFNRRFVQRLLPPEPAPPTPQAAPPTPAPLARTDGAVPRTPRRDGGLGDWRGPDAEDMPIPFAPQPRDVPPAFAPPAGAVPRPFARDERGRFRRAMDTVGYVARRIHQDVSWPPRRPSGLNRMHLTVPMIADAPRLLTIGGQVLREPSGGFLRMPGFAV